jgi:hypothetical protein
MRLIFVISLLILSTHTTIAAEKPILQIDPGGHKALIRDIVFTPDGRSLVSCFFVGAGEKVD